MMKETTTIYAYKLQYVENLTFDKIRGFAKRFIDELPKPLVDDLYSQLERGVVQIDSEPQMLVYLYAFGNMHQAKLNKAFENVPEVFFEQPEINIIDYGCGQAIGTMCYLDFIRQKGVSQKVKRVTLIEPSEICLKRAALHTSAFLPKAEILTVNNTFDELSEEDINCEESVPTLHILSNVLDLDFDFENFAELIKGRLQGYNQFVCVGPYFGFSDKDERLEEFCSLLDGKSNFYKVFDKYQLNPEKAWTAQIRCFSVGELEEDLSTKVTKEDIENGVEDEYGVVYSRDGKRLLKCRNKDLESYVIKDGTRIICDYAFSCSSSSLQQVTIPDSVTSIGDGAFASCSSLQQVILPKSIALIGRNPFECCEKIEIHSKSPRYIANRECLIDKERHILITYFGHSSSVDIPNSVTSIGEGAFAWCKSLQQVTIPDSVTSIGDCAFACCVSLQQIMIPDSVTSIGGSSFEACYSLQQVMIPDSVTSIGYCAFLACKSLQQVTISDSVTSIGDYAFACCESLQQIIIPENSVEKFKQMLPKDLWGKLYYLVKAVNEVAPPAPAPPVVDAASGLPF